jgi:dihydrofolate reductase
MQTKPKISIVVAVTSKHHAIGKENGLIFRISDDLNRFKALTRGHPIIWGRKTFESIGHPLPERTNIIITRNPDYKAEGCVVVSSLEEALKKASELDQELITIGGGGDIYRQVLPFVDKLHLTIIESDVTGGATFPDWRKDFTKETFREERFDEKTGLKYMWIDLERD